MPYREKIARYGAATGVAAVIWAMSFILLIFDNPQDPLFPYSGEAGRFISALGVVVFFAAQYIKMTSLEEQMVKVSNKLQSDVDVGSKLYNLVKEAGVIDRESLEIFRPNDVNEFRKYFAGASEVLAYNPPLNLLVQSKPHREIIYNILNDERTIYRLISGKSLLGRLVDLRKKWKADLQLKFGSRSRADENLKKFHILMYGHEDDLFTKISSWMDDPGFDLRGLSFFLIKGASRNTVVLYILGSPFVRAFEVPSKAIAISMRRRTAEGKNLDFALYNDMKAEFESRWSQISNIFSKEGCSNCLETNLCDLDIKLEKSD